VEENSFANGGIARGLPMRGADCAPWVSVNGLVYLSALSGASIAGFTEGCDLPHSSAQAQTLAALANVEAMLNAAGTNKYNLVDVVVMVVDPGDVDMVQNGWSHFIADMSSPNPNSLPTKTVMIGPSASQQEGCRVELKVIAKL